MLPRDYRLHELNDVEFEQLCVKIASKWLGQGVTGFSRGKDGGRDGKFIGRANSFPSITKPHEGYFTLQAKHTAAPNKSCSEKDFHRILSDEHEQIKRLINEGLLDHYIVFTNRKYSGLTDEKLIAKLMGLGLKSAQIIGVERLHQALDEFPDIRDTLPNRYDTSPFRFNSDDFIEVIEAFSAFTNDGMESSFNSAFDFDKIKISQKNEINGLSRDFYDQVIVDTSMPHFENVEQFLTNPRNAQFADLYHDIADELKAKILAKRSHFTTFDDVFAFLYEKIQEQREALKFKRRLVSILLHYMYCNCDIGSKQVSSETVEC